jgi:hypothetical protein
MPNAIFISSSLILRIRFGFSGLVNIQRQLVHCDPPRLIAREELVGPRSFSFTVL